MEVAIGTVARSKKGRDVTQYYVIMGFEAIGGIKRFLLCNGSKFTLNKPKHKNIMHVQLTKTVLECNNLENDVKLKKALKDYENNLGQINKGGEVACLKKM
jgi:ribosomal protein L14E/L6E/L27E